MNTWAPYAEIVVDVANNAVNRGFHYQIPENLRGHILPGMRVLVPFGNRKLEGYVIKLSEKSPVKQIKPIIKAIDAEPIFTSNLLQLALWMADYYLCTIVEVLQCMMPTGIKLEGQKMVSLTDLGWELLAAEEQGELNAEEVELLKVLSNFNGHTSLNLLNRNLGAKARNLVPKLGQKGLINLETVMTSKVNKKYHKVLQVKLAQDKIAETMADLAIRAPKQAQVLAEAVASPGLTVTEAAAAAKVSSSVVKALVEKQILILVEEELERDPYANRDFPATKPMVPTPEQAAALQQIYQSLNQGKPQTFLVHGVTGSGKTEIYLQAIARVLQQGKQAIVLVPEISLTPQMVSRFKGRFGSQVAVLHSRLSLGERYDEWRKIKEKRVNVVVGARSAIFAPFDNLGLIIIDEEHESSYKQEEKPRYHAREVALKRAELEQATVILGSATPAIESYYQAETGVFQLLTLHQRIESRPLPEVTLVDLREELQQGNKSIFSQPLLEKIQDRLNKHEQVILFLNRRGYSTFVLCRECGLVLKCPNCDISLTYHNSGRLQCHYCGHHELAPTLCPKCQSKYIRYFGIGTQKVEEELHKMFPQARVQRMDVDTTTLKGSHERILDNFQQGEVDILVGTQMIAKGLDFPNVTLVGVITADTSLNLPDYKAGERTFQLLTQVAGRAGRAQKLGEVIVQSYSPDHYSVQAAQRHDYASFYTEELDLRKIMDYPPFTALIKVVISGEDEAKVIRGAESLKDCLLLSNLAGVEILGPAPAPLSKIKKRYRWHLALKAQNQSAAKQVLVAGLAKLNLKDKDVRIAVDVDPQSML